MRRSLRIAVLRFVVAVVGGVLLSVGFAYVWYRAGSHACEALFTPVADVLQLGFEGAMVAIFAPSFPWR